jgi:hypothetical protein
VAQIPHDERPFSVVVPLERVSILLRFMVLPEHRGSMLPFLMIVRAGQMMIHQWGQRASVIPSASTARAKPSPRAANAARSDSV